eukprot:12766-Heterococcus_DN1.PRE.1
MYAQLICFAAVSETRYTVLELCMARQIPQDQQTIALHSMHYCCAVVLCDKPAATTALQIAAFDHTTTSVERRAAVASQKSSSSSVRALKWTLARSYYQASLAAACRF